MRWTQMRGLARSVRRAVTCLLPQAEWAFQVGYIILLSYAISTILLALGRVNMQATSA